MIPKSRFALFSPTRLRKLAKSYPKPNDDVGEGQVKAQYRLGLRRFASSDAPAKTLRSAVSQPCTSAIKSSIGVLSPRFVPESPLAGFRLLRFLQLSLFLAHLPTYSSNVRRCQLSETPILREKSPSQSGSKPSSCRHSQTSRAMLSALFS